MENKPEIPQKTPLGLEVEAGKQYWWCTCGKSENQPFCDGKHKGGNFVPKQVSFDENKQVWWCACKHTSNELGLCDGSHKTL